MDFLEMMRLEPHGPDTWVGIGPKYPWGGLYGGQIVAQGLCAAAKSVEPQFQVHSLHAYFIRRGDHTAPVRYEVDRVRDGRSFCTRNVIARQSTGAILNLIASFQMPEAEAEKQTVVAPVVARPEEVQNTSWSQIFERRALKKPKGHDPKDTGRRAWLRIASALPDDPLLHACGLAYVSDDLPTEAVIARHPDHISNPLTPFFNASLDHAIWFHDSVKADEHYLYDFDCHAIRGGRGLTIGHVFDAAGKHVATINQEVLIRKGRG